MASRNPVSGGGRNSIGRDIKGFFKAEGFAQAAKALDGVVDAVVGARMKDVYYEAGVIYRDEAIRLAPYDPDRKEGVHLNEAIFVSRGRESEPNVLVGVRYFPGGAPHAHLQEYGWAEGQAQPYMRPAGQNVGGQVAEVIRDGLIEIVESIKK